MLPLIKRHTPARSRWHPPWTADQGTSSPHRGAFGLNHFDVPPSSWGHNSQIGAIHISYDSYAATPQLTLDTPVWLLARQRCLARESAVLVRPLSGPG